MALAQLKTGSKELRTVVNAIATAVDAEAAAGNVSTADLAANAVTGAKIAAAAMKYLGFTGKNGAGACTLTGAAVGDKVAGVANTTDGGTGSSLFETTITVVNQIQQSSATDLSTKKFTVMLIAAA